MLNVDQPQPLKPRALSMWNSPIPIHILSGHVKSAWPHTTHMYRYCMLSQTYSYTLCDCYHEQQENCENLFRETNKQPEFIGSNVPAFSEN